MFGSLGIASSIATMASYGWRALSDGGWIAVVFLVTWIVYKLYMKKIQDDFVLSNEQIFLHVKVERENLQSTLAVERLFTQIHAMHENFTPAEKYLEGRVQLWMSFEIVSIGGQISYIMRTPKRYRAVLESAIYSNYPNAEITEVEDYMKNLKHWDTDSGWDLWGTEMKLVKDYAYPIKTYDQFEHPAAEEPIIDPMGAVLEALSRMEPYELMAVQVVIKPTGDKEWTPHIRDVVKELKKEVEHKTTLWGKIFAPFNWFGEKLLHERLLEVGAAGHEEERPFPAVQRMSEGEKEVLKAIEDKATRVAWLTKIRMLYIAPKDRFDKTKRIALIGAFRQFSGVSTNSLKPDVSGTWTGYHYHLFEKLEDPFVQFQIRERKHNILKGFANRSAWVGAPAMLLNAQEIATIYHFPLATASTAPVERIDIKKGQPPANLPVL